MQEKAFYGDLFMRWRKNQSLSYGTKNTNIEIHALEYVMLGKEWNYSGVASPYSRIYIPRAGEGKITAGGKTEILTPGRIYIIPAMLAHSVECPLYLEKLFAHVSIIKPDGLDALACAKKILVLDDAELANSMLALWESCDIEAALNMRLLLFSAVMRAVRNEGVELGLWRRYSSVTDAAISYVSRNLTAKLTIDEIARATHTSRTSLQKAFRDDVGIPIGKYIDRRLMALGERELIYGEKSISEISDMLGFCDRFYFSRKFAEFFGLSPSRYAQKQRGADGKEE